MTRQTLENKVKYLAGLLGVSYDEYNVPYALMLDGANGGYKLEQVCANGCGVNNLTDRYAPKIFGLVLDSMIKGAELRGGQNA